MRVSQISCHNSNSYSLCKELFKNWEEVTNLLRKKKKKFHMIWIQGF